MDILLNEMSSKARRQVLLISSDGSFRSNCSGFAEVKTWEMGTCLYAHINYCYILL